MSDPFGTDDIDFDIDTMLSSAYKNALAILLDDREPLGTHNVPELHNPLRRKSLPRDAMQTFATMEKADAESLPGSAPRSAPGSAMLRCPPGSAQGGAPGSAPGPRAVERVSTPNAQLHLGWMHADDAQQAKGWLCSAALAVCSCRVVRSLISVPSASGAGGAGRRTATCRVCRCGSEMTTLCARQSWMSAQ
eukprot:5222603-Prymnesium_polylepis.1